MRIASSVSSKRKSGAVAEPILHQVTTTICSLCLDGAGGECHTPGCALWLCRAPDMPLRKTIADLGGEIRAPCGGSRCFEHEGKWIHSSKSYSSCAVLAATFGAPGVRDPDLPCKVYDPGEPSGQCDSDGHYLCKECRHLKVHDG